MILETTYGNVNYIESPIYDRKQVIVSVPFCCQKVGFPNGSTRTDGVYKLSIILKYDGMIKIFLEILSDINKKIDCFIYKVIIRFISKYNL